MEGRRGGGGCLFEAGRSLNFSAFRMGAYSWWALIRGWALILINTLIENSYFFPLFVMKAVYLQVRLKRNSKHISGNSLSASGTQNKYIGTALQIILLQQR